ncbi:MAG: BrnT family toxin [Pyrinomonadaceae bacterium]
MIFEWDENKAKSNLRKHEIDFEEAQTIFGDPFVATFLDDFHSRKEEIYQHRAFKPQPCFARRPFENPDNFGVISIRIISCRRVANLERKIYEEQF